jgi:hypothetical protein
MVGKKERKASVKPLTPNSGDTPRRLNIRPSPIAARHRAVVARILWKIVFIILYLLYIR